MTLDEALAQNAALQAGLTSLTAALAASQAENRRLVAMVERLTGQLDALLARLNPSEAGDEDDEKAETKPETSSENTGAGEPSKKEKKPKKVHRHGRGALPEKLARDTVVVPKPLVCPHCHETALVVVEMTESEQYDYVRAHLRVRKTVRTICRCKHCLKRITPPLPPQPFDQASCTFALLCWVLYAKGALHLPLDRQRVELGRQGARISTAMITRWFARGADLLAPIVSELHRQLLAGSHLRFDGTGLPILDITHPDQPTFTGQILVFCTPALALYHYAPTKEGQHIQDFLSVEIEQDGEKKRVPWQGTATADAFSAHDRLFGDGGALEGGCNAHGLRKFRDDADKAPLLADAALSFLGLLFQAERDAAAAGLTGAALLAHRQAHAAPVALRLHAWLVAHQNDLLPKNPIRKAIRYYLKHWNALMRFLTDPAVPIDNNLSERLIKPIALGRNAWLFAGGAVGARRVAAVLSLIETCKLLHLDPYDYLLWALPRLVPHPDNRGLRPADLTPAAYQKALQQANGQEAFP